MFLSKKRLADAQYLITNLIIRSKEAAVHRCSSKLVVLKNFAIFTRKHLCWSLFLIQLQTSSPATILKGNCSTVLSCKYCKTWTCRPCVKLLRTSILKTICKWLLLKVNQCFLIIIVLNLLWKSYFMCILSKTELLLD